MRHIERICRECRTPEGDWHDKYCTVGRSGPGRVRDVDVEVIEYVHHTRAEALWILGRIQGDTSPIATELRTKMLAFLTE